MNFNTFIFSILKNKTGLILVTVTSQEINVPFNSGSIRQADRPENPAISKNIVRPRKKSGVIIVLLYFFWI
jgi:hypothetical protein